MSFRRGTRRTIAKGLVGAIEILVPELGLFDLAVGLHLVKHYLIELAMLLIIRLQYLNCNFYNNLFMNFFGYIYYRIAELMFKKDGRLAARALILISLMQSFMIAIIITPVFRYFFGEKFYDYSKQYGWLGGSIFMVLVVLNYLIHHKRYDDYLQKWHNETKSVRFVKGIFVIVALISPIIIFMILNVHG